MYAINDNSCDMCNLFTVTMACLWNQDQSDVELISRISQALDYWFDNDFHEDDCINAGGVEGLNCPCGTPGLWNTNWYDQVNKDTQDS